MMMAAVATTRRAAARLAGSVTPRTVLAARCIAGSDACEAARARVGRVRRFARSARSSPKLVSFAKRQQRERALALHGTSMFESVNDPRMMPKSLRHADRTAAKLGTDAALASFDEAAAGFANPPPLVAATILERDPVVMRAPEEWEAEFLQFQEKVDEKYAKEYPEEFIERQVAFAAKLEAESGGGGTYDAAAAPVAGVEGASSFDRFYAVDDADEDEDDNAQEELDFQPLPRETQADAIDDRRSLDRALQDRLVLLVKRAKDDRWVLPQTVRDDDERMVEAAKRGLTAAFGGDVDAWYPGNAPMAHRLEVYSPEEQAAASSYGEKVFMYRAVLLGGKLELGAEYSDFVWVRRDEAVDYLNGDEFLFMHQVFGGDSVTDGGKSARQILDAKSG